MKLHFKPDSLNLWCEHPVPRLSGAHLADLTLLVEGLWQGEEPLELRTEDLTLGLKHSSGRLLYVSSPQEINGKWQHTMLPEQPGALRLLFWLPAHLPPLLSALSSLTLEAHDALLLVDPPELERRLSLPL
ncbi:MAG: hypothetical protein ACO1RX_20305 [Candidatus Sericytochromatia bacterium]